MKRKSLGQLLGAFYYPTSSFAFLSMISFLIKPDVVRYVLCNKLSNNKIMYISIFIRFLGEWE
jgi:hypothetical protein